MEVAVTRDDRAGKEDAGYDGGAFWPCNVRGVEELILEEAFEVGKNDEKGDKQ